MANDFDAWLGENEFDPTELSSAQRIKLEGAWRAENNAAADPRPREFPADDDPFQTKVRGIEAEAERKAYIRRTGLELMARYDHDPERVEQIKGVVAGAVADPKVDARSWDLAVLRMDRSQGVDNHIRHRDGVTAKVVEAAVCKAGGLPDLERYYDARTLEATDQHFRHGLGLQDLVRHFAERGGWRGSNFKAALHSEAVLRAAFREEAGAGGRGWDLRAGVAGPSTYSLPVIVGNVANKFLRRGFESVDMAWKMIAATRSVPDFKQITTASLTGSLIYQKLAPGGEIEHGTIGERTYTNQANTYAIMLGIDNRDLVNDDIGALTTASFRVGRGGALTINDRFWTIFLNNSSFFTSGNANVSTGAGSALASAGVKAADRVFRVQTDPDGLPLAATPKILLVPPTLWYTARELMNSSLNTGTTTANTLLPATNIFQGSYQVVTSAYMENTAYTGNSTAAWYILADPNDVPVIEGVFVNGQQDPTVETTQADFNTLGIAMRGYLHFDFALQEFRGGVRSAGS